MNIPKNKNYPDTAGQCDQCGGHGCNTCDDKGWLPAGHPRIRICALAGCNQPIPPHQAAIYCSNACARHDAD